METIFIIAALNKAKLNHTIIHNIELSSGCIVEGVEYREYTFTYGDIRNPERKSVEVEL